MTKQAETGRYRRDNEPTNDNCSDCKDPIWVRKGVYTTYNGKEHWANSFLNKKPESITIVDVTLSGITFRHICNKCVANYSFEHGTGEL